MSFVSELKRRKVFQVAAVYLVVAWLIMQVVDVVNEPLRLPEWFATVAILIVAIGFPIALILSWAFDLTPEGVVKDQGTNVTVQSSGRRIEYIFAGLLVIAVATLLYREFTPPEPAVEVVAEETQREVLPNSVAVLPFTNLSPDPDNAFYADGIHIELLSLLHKIQDLTAIARDSVVRFRNSDLSNEEIARELRVGAIVRGDVRFSGNSLRVSAELIDPATNVPIWADVYNGDLADVFEFQSEIAGSIAMALEAELLPREQASLEEAPTKSPAAYSAYLQARALVPVIRQYNSADFYNYLDQAIEIDPNFALAHATKAFGYASELTGAGFGPFGESHEEQEAIARAHVDRALELDTTQSLAWGALALIAEAYWRAAEARTNWEEAVQLSPNDADILTHFARFNAFTRRDEEAIRLAKRVAELNPAGAADVLYFTNYLAGNYVTAVSFHREMVSASPTNPTWRHRHGHLQLALGNNEAALDEFLAVEVLLTDRVDAPTYLASLAYGYGRVGRRADAERFFSWLQAYDEQSGSADRLVLPREWAIAYLGLGDHKQALEWLEVAADSRNPGEGGINNTMFLARNAYDDPILNQPEFVEVRSRLGFRE